SGSAILDNFGTWLDENSSNPTSITGAASTFNNSGSYIKSGSSATTIYTAFNNTGSLSVQAGTLSLAGGGTLSGSEDVLAGATLNFNGGTYAVSNLGTGAGTGRLLVSGGTLNTGGTNSFAGTV